ncbi:hypothetical protein AVEN_114699-1 [Araneus ventricosus]|uniref:Uncharacterized protein n=1 Tax=Araneus ventricosus TaxID=182803 RepID=A0A4Y2RNS9_ARAVE|nr:hypothetical protein AVEN_114699-1 [Araneus ventricosus]
MRDARRRPDGHKKVERMMCDADQEGVNRALWFHYQRFMRQPLRHRSVPHEPLHHCYILPGSETAHLYGKLSSPYLRAVALLLRVTDVSFRQVMPVEEAGGRQQIAKWTFFQRPSHGPFVKT